MEAVLIRVPSVESSVPRQRIVQIWLCFLLSLNLPLSSSILRAAGNLGSSEPPTASLCSMTFSALCSSCSSVLPLQALGNSLSPNALAVIGLFSVGPLISFLFFLGIKGRAVYTWRYLEGSLAVPV